MVDDSKYDDIRPYRDNELQGVLDRMLGSKLADILISTVFPSAPVDLIKRQLKELQTINEFQGKVVNRALQGILAKTSSGLTKSGGEHLDTGQSYLFISNHRDIILDPSILNSALIEFGFETTENAIGDNLLSTPWVKDLARLNKSFIVKRNLSVRELMASSQLLSGYISEVVTQRKQCVWIAQREGRAKDGNDRTQPGLLTMVGMAAESSLKEHFMNMNLVPVSISYEHDPCDVDKARSLYAQKLFGGYTKEKNEDNLAMRKGILGFKGKIHIHIGKPIREDIAQLPDDLHKNELIQQVGLLLDRQIIGNYGIQKSNRIAFDLLNKSKEGKVAYNADDEKEFIEDIDSKIGTMAGEPGELRSIFLQMYARPYQNKLELKKEYSNS